MATEKKVNYTDEDAARLKALYVEHGNDGIAKIAEAMGKSVSSVRAKLISEKVWVPKEKAKAEPKRTGPSKKELIAGIVATEPSLDSVQEGFTGCPIVTLAAVFSVLTANRREREEAASETGNTESAAA